MRASSSGVTGNVTVRVMSGEEVSVRGRQAVGRQVENVHTWGGGGRRGRKCDVVRGMNMCSTADMTAACISVSKILEP